MRPLKVNKARSDELERLLAISRKSWRDLLDGLTQADPGPLTVDELSRVLSAKVGADDGATLAATAISLQRLARQERVDPGIVLDALTQGLLRFGWDSKKIKKWDSIRSHLVDVIGHEATDVVAKSSDLFFRHAHHIHEIKIISDLRPVFSADRSDVVAFITQNVMSITYSNPHEKEDVLELSIGMDELENLRDEVEAALGKSRKLDELVTDKLRLRNRFYTSD